MSLGIPSGDGVWETPMFGMSNKQTAPAGLGIPSQGFPSSSHRPTGFVASSLIKITPQSKIIEALEKQSHYIHFIPCFLPSGSFSLVRKIKDKSCSAPTPTKGDTQLCLHLKPKSLQSFKMCILLCEKHQACTKINAGIYM